MLLEAEEHLSNTIYRYQKGKFVMDEPGILPLRRRCRSRPAARESILDGWDDRPSSSRSTCATSTKSVRSSRPATVLRSNARNGQTVEADFVVMGIGLQGNIRKLGCPGEDLAVRAIPAR